MNAPDTGPVVEQLALLLHVDECDPGDLHRVLSVLIAWRRADHVVSLGAALDSKVLKRHIYTYICIDA